MPRLGPVLLAILAAPVVMFVMHAIAFRALRMAGARPTAHSSAFLAIAATLVPLSAALWSLGAFERGSGSMATLCTLGYVAIVYGALAVLYLDVVNVAETSLHMHLLLELAWGGAVPIADLLDRYSPDRMIAARIERLTSLGQLRVVDGRCFIGNRSTLYLSSAIDAWRRVLGLPTTPPEPSTNAADAAGRAVWRPTSE